MRVCIPIEFKPHGGGFYFLENLANYLKEQGHDVIRQIKDSYDLLFTNHWMVSRSEILRAMRHNPQVRIVQRIDGAAQDYGRDPEADVRQNRVNELADLTIFQSDYARFATREKFKVIRQDGPVIHNPVDLELFRPNGPKVKLPEGPKLVSVTWSKNPTKGAASIYEVARANPELNFVLAGNYPDAPVLANITNLGVQTREELAKVLRSCDLMLTFSQNEACPNHVLEALASGLPVLYLDSGAMSEVIADAGRPIKESDFRSAFDELIERREELSRRARARAEEKFKPQRIFARYAEELGAVLSSPPHVSITRRRLLSWLDRLRIGTLRVLRMLLRGRS